MSRETLYHTKAFVVALALWSAAVTSVSAQVETDLLTVAVPDNRLSVAYHDAVASRGSLESLADVPSMTQQAWPLLQSIGRADADHRADLYRLTSDAAPSLTQEQRIEIRSQLASNYLDQPEVLASLSTDDFCLLIDACWDVGVSNTLIGEVILDRLSKTEFRQIDKAGDTRVLLRALKYLTSDEARQAKKDLVDHLWEEQLASPAYLREQDAWELFKLIQTTASQTSPQRGQRWAEFYMDYLFAGGDASLNIGPVELLTVGRSLDVARKTMEGQGYTEYAQALANAIEEGQPFGFKFILDYRYLAAPLGTEETRQVVRDVLTDDQGTVRLEAAKIMGWAYQRVGQLGEWESFLDTETAGSDGDAQALWLLARSHSEEVKYPTGSPAAGRRWVESALERTETEQIRLVCVRWMMERLESAKYYDQASEFLDSVQDDFESAESKRMLTALAVHLDRERTSNEIYKQRKKERETRYRLTQRIVTLKQRIERAASLENAEYETAKLQTMLERAEQELAVLGR